MATLADTVRAAVVSRHAVDQRERVSIAAFLQYFDNLAAPFSEEADVVHVTGSAFVLGLQGIVLHRHKRLGIWLQPGGHIDPGETPWGAAFRETVEETGLPVRHPRSGPTLVHVDVHAGPRGHTHLDLRYLLLSDDVDPSPPEGESQDVRWFSFDEALKIVDDSNRGAFSALFASFDISELHTE